MTEEDEPVVHVLQKIKVEEITIGGGEPVALPRQFLHFPEKGGVNGVQVAASEGPRGEVVFF
jgi:hypothetical protein